MGEQTAIGRRVFLRRIGVTGAALAWTTPVMQTVFAGRAFAASGGDQWSICVGACQEAPSTCPPGLLAADPTNTGCQVICTMMCGNPNQNLACCNPDVLTPQFWCSKTGKTHGACYFGSVAGCNGVGYNAACCGGQNAICATKDGPTNTCQCTS
jgi:hypothetical protein